MYRQNGANRLPVSVSRLNEPEYSYTLVKEDVGYYLMAAVAPKHLRCVPGKEQIVVSNSPIKKGQVNIAHIFETDFRTFHVRINHNFYRDFGRLVDISLWIRQHTIGR